MCIHSLLITIPAFESRLQFLVNFVVIANSTQKKFLPNLSVCNTHNISESVFLLVLVAQQAGFGLTWPKTLKILRFFLHIGLGYLRFYPGIENLILPMISYPGRQVTSSCEVAS